MATRLEQQKALLRTLTNAIAYAERLGLDAEVDALLVIKAIARRASDEQRLEKSVVRFDPKRSPKRR